MSAQRDFLDQSAPEPLYPGGVPSAGTDPHLARSVRRALRAVRRPLPHLTAPMQRALAAMRQHGALHRYPGGFWARPDWDWRGESFGTSTIEAVVTRGHAAYTEWKDGRHGRFPITVSLQGTSNEDQA